MARPKKLSDSEKKSARVSLLMTPKLFDDVTTLAQILKVSVNDLFCSLAAQAVKKNRPAIDRVQSVIEDVAGTVSLPLDFDELDADVEGGELA